MTMPTFTRLIVALLGFAIVVPELPARSLPKKGGGGAKKARPMKSQQRSRPAPRKSTQQRSRPSSSSKRNTMTGSKIQRQQVKPKARPKPQSRPTPKTSSRPKVSNTTKQRPTSKPANRPSLSKPDARPGTSGKRPSIPDKRPAQKRPDLKKPTTMPGMVSYPKKADNKLKKPDIGDRKGDGKLAGKVGDRKGDGNLAGKVGDRKGDGKLADKVGDRKGDGKLGDKIGDRKGDGKIADRVGDRDRDRGLRDHNRGRDVHIDNVNVGKRNRGLNRPGNLPAKNRNWNDNKWGGKKGVWGNNINVGNDVNIDMNFRRNNNFAYRPNYWGGRPWWGAGHYHGWHHGHWHCGWNSRYYRRHWYYHDNDFAAGFMWGITVWSIGSLCYDMGYKSYSNPYPAPPVQNTYINYTEPVAVQAAANPPGDEAAVATAEEESEAALARSQDAFKSGDYLAASKAIDEALSHTPDDVTLHEFRALIFFALGKYGDAAGVLNPVLASGPGWGWETMIGFYDKSSTYDEQLRKLEAYTKGSPSKADAQFVLGYHYLVADNLVEANAAFAKTAELQPSDSIAIQLRDLTRDSIPDSGDSAEDTEVAERPDPVSSDALVGTWVNDQGDAGKVVFEMKDNGDFSWDFTGAGDGAELEGTFGLDEQGLLVLTTDDSQMVSVVDLKEDDQLHFALVGSPDGDPGLNFVKEG